MNEVKGGKWMRTCTIGGCEKKYHSGGFCQMHYRRKVVHGSPYAAKRQKSDHGKPFDVLSEILKSRPRKECIIWPLPRSNGYAQIRRGGKAMWVHRVVCEETHGPSPSECHQVLHKCGNGEGGCVNPRHLVWGLPLENADDKRRHGTNITKKLTEDDVRKIRRIQGSLSNKAVARLMGVSISTVYDILSGKTWASTP